MPLHPWLQSSLLCACICCQGGLLYPRTMYTHSQSNVTSLLGVHASSLCVSPIRLVTGANTLHDRSSSCLCRPRLLATCGAWFLWDFSFYGNKVFQSTFIAVLSPSGAGQPVPLPSPLASGAASLTIFDNTCCMYLAHAGQCCIHC